MVIYVTIAIQSNQRNPEMIREIPLRTIVLVFMIGIETSP